MKKESSIHLCFTFCTFLCLYENCSRLIGCNEYYYLICQLLLFSLKETLVISTWAFVVISAHHAIERHSEDNVIEIRCDS